MRMYSEQGVILVVVAIICSSCGKPCTGEVLKVQERHFHITCFKCHGNTDNRIHECITSTYNECV